MMDESDEDLDEDFSDGKYGAPEEEPEDEIIESDIVLEGETVEADNDPPQKVIMCAYRNAELMSCTIFNC